MKRRTATAFLGNTLIASTTRGVLVEGNLYFPESDVDSDLLTPSALTTVCPWKGVARYRHLRVSGAEVRNAAWTYPLPTPFAWFLRRMIAFEPGTGVTIQPTPLSESPTHD